MCIEYAMPMLNLLRQQAMTWMTWLSGRAVCGLLAGFDQTGQWQWRFHSEALGSQHGAAQAHLQRPGWGKSGKNGEKWGKMAEPRENS